MAAFQKFRIHFSKLAIWASHSPLQYESKYIEMLIYRDMNDEKPKLGDEAPAWKHIIIVLIIAGLLIAFSWISWFKFGWFH